MNISVIICAYNDRRWETLVAAITSLQQQSLHPYEIVPVIDNNPHLAERVRAQFTDIRVLENRGPRGLSQARNVGIVHASGDVVAFIDDDAIADKHWLFQLAQCYTNEQVVGAGGYIGSAWPGGRPIWFPEEFEWVVGCSYRGLPTEARPVRNFIGCNMSFRREALVAVNGFQNELGRVDAHPVGCEETELCIRIQSRQPDGILLYIPGAKVRHIITESRKDWRYFISRCYYEGRSKAQVAHLVGAGDGLSSERSYTLKTLPMGVLFGIVDTIAQRNLWGLVRSGAIIVGFSLTVFGYLTGTITQRTRIVVPSALQSPPINEPKREDKELVKQFEKNRSAK